MQRFFQLFLRRLSFAIGGSVLVGAFLYFAGALPVWPELKDTIEYGAILFGACAALAALQWAFEQLWRLKNTN
jgi:hypothetical protein